MEINLIYPRIKILKICPYIYIYIYIYIREGLLSQNVNNRATPFSREGGMELDASPFQCRKDCLVK